MRVVVHPADDGGCGRYRLRWPAEALAAQGHDVAVEFEHAYRGVMQPSVFGDRLVALADPVEADVVVLQRPLKRETVELIAALQDQGVAVVVEVDDDFHALHRRNPAWTETHPGRDRDKNRDWLALACQRADLVTVTTPALAERYGHHGRVRVLPNCVPERYLSLLTKPKERLTLGWSGSVVTHPGDLDQAKGAVQPVLDQHDAAFHVVGTGEGVQRALALRDEPTATGWLPIEDYPSGLADLDVGIVPLRASEFNEAKSWLKGLEMAAVGVPFVATPTSPYRSLVAEGAGWLAGTAGSWTSMVGALCASTGLRAHMAGKGREVAARWTVEGRAWQWMEAWADARDIARSRFVKVAM